MDKDVLRRSDSRERALSVPEPGREFDDEYEIDLIQLLYFLLDKIRWILLVALLGAVLVGVVSKFLITPKYTATSKLYVLSANDAAINLSDFQIGTYLTADYQEVFSNWHVHERVIQKLSLPYSYDQISNMLEVTNPTGTRILYITVTAEDPQQAKLIADTYATVAREFVASTMDTEEPNLFEEALLPTYPSSPSVSRNTALGFALFMLGACGVFTVQFLLDDKIRTGEDLEKYFGIPTLGLLSVQEGHMMVSAHRQQSDGEVSA